MEFIEKSCCVVTVSEAFSAKKRVSCSGVVLDSRTGTVICNALPFSRFIIDKESMSADPRVLLPHSFSEKLNIGVSFSEQRSLDTNQCAYETCTESKSVRTLQHEATAELLMLVNCVEFREAFLAVFQEADKWRFHGDEEDEELTRDSQFLGWFALLKADFADTSPDSGGIPWHGSSPLQKGWQVVACGSPFGALCPDLFISTLSKGIISNLAGQGNAVILTDARCLPGTEGGGLFLPKGNRAYLVGLIVSPLCWKANEWIGLTLVCSVQLIFRNIICCMNVQDPQRDIYLHEGEPDLHLSSTAHLSKAAKYPTVCLIDSGQFWGSGVLVSPQLALTCRHVVNGKPFVTLRFCHRNGFHETVGDVLFSTKASSPYDLAVVQLRGSAPEVVVSELAKSFQPGEDVMVVGYGGLGRRCGPSLTCGVLSKAISWKDQPVMLQTTCAVQAGASGGAVVQAQSGKLLGIVSSNTRDFAAQVTYPHLNFSVPVTVFQPLLRSFDRTGDAEVFRALDATEEGVRRVWRLQGAQSKL